MKKLLFHWLTRNSGTYINRHYGPVRYSKRRKSPLAKLKVYLAVAGVMVLLVGGLLAGGAIYLTTQLVSGVSGQLTTERVDDARAKLSAVGSKPLVNPGCLNTLSTMLDPTRWLTQPIRANLQSIQASCVGDDSPQPKQS